MFARVFMRQQIALVALSLFDDDDAKKGVAIDKRTQREERGFRDHHFSTASLFLCVSTQQKRADMLLRYLGSGLVPTGRFIGQKKCAALRFADRY